MQIFSISQEPLFSLFYSFWLKIHECFSNHSGTSSTWTSSILRAQFAVSTRAGSLTSVSLTQRNWRHPDFIRLLLHLVWIITNRSNRNKKSKQIFLSASVSPNSDSNSGTVWLKMCSNFLVFVLYFLTPLTPIKIFLQSPTITWLQRLSISSNCPRPMNYTKYTIRISIHFLKKLLSE